MTFTKSVLACALLAALQAQAAETPWRIKLDGYTSEVDAVVEDGAGAGAYWVDVAELSAVGVMLKGVTVTNNRVNLADLGKVELNELTGTLTVHVKSELRPPVSINMAGVALYQRPDAPVAGFYLNHDTRLDSSNGFSTASSLWDSNVSIGGWRGNLQTMMRAGSGATQKRFEKLNASVSRDNLDRSTVLTFGDAWSAGGENVAPAYFSGVQYKTDYAGLNPGFFTQPTMRLAGTANAPSVMDIVVNNQVVAQKNIPAGPFSVSNIMPVTGMNNAQVIVRDAFGQQQVLSAELAGGPRLLKTGLTDYSAQAGQLKGGNNSMFFAGYTRTGINDWLTGEANVEAGRMQRFGANLAVGTRVGSLSAGVRLGAGNKLDLAYQNAFRGDGWFGTFNANLTRVSPGYQLLGGGVQQNAATVSASFQANRWIYSAMKTNTGGVRMASLSASLIPQHNDIMWSFNLMQSSFATSKTASFLVNAVIPLESESSRKTITAGLQQSNQELVQRVAGDIAPLSNRGVTYRFAGQRSQTQNRLDASFDYVGDQFDAGVAVSNAGQQTGFRANLRGAVVVSDGFVATSRAIQGGAILVDAKGTGLEGTEVFLNGTHANTLNASGRAVLTGFSPFIQTRVDILPDDPMFNEVSGTTATARNGIAKIEFKPVTAAMIAIPGFSAGVLVVEGKRFPVTDRGAFVEMPVGKYTGYVNGKTQIDFEVKG